MALATQCPHCGTTFRVASDQLKLRGGIVRCGACNEVFDGNASLIDPDAPAPEAPEPQAPEAPEPQAPSASDAFDAEVAAIDAAPPPAAGEEPVYTLDFDTTLDPYGILPKPPEPEPEPEPEPVIEEIDTTPAPHEVLDLDIAGTHSELPISEPSPASLLMRATATPEDALPAQAPAEEAPAPSRKKKKRPHAPAPVAVAEAVEEVDEPEFVRRSRLAEQSGRTRRLTMIGGSVLLVLALLAQGMLTFRNLLAASYPQLKPALSSACALLGCRVELPAQIENLSIETGELQTLGPNTFSFTTLLRNGSGLVQAWPHIELTLNDNNDKPVVRRVFAPSEYLPKDVAAAKGFAARSEQPVKLYFELDQLKASGYHLAIFYP